MGDGAKKACPLTAGPVCAIVKRGAWHAAGTAKHQATQLLDDSNIEGVPMNEMVTVQLRIPGEWMQDLRDQATLLEVLGLGLETYHLRRALAFYQKGEVPWAT